MKKLIFLVLVNLTTLGVNASRGAAPDEVDTYEQKLNSLSSSLMDHAFYSNYLKDIDARRTTACQKQIGIFCRQSEIKTGLLAIQNGELKFIPPIKVPQNARELLLAIQSLSDCKNLGFMNVRDVPSEEGGPPPVPFRPTKGFGIYKFPFLGRNILLVRGSEYNLAWPFWGADTLGTSLPPVPPKTDSLGGDFLTEIDAHNCRVIDQFNLERINIFEGTNYTHESFSEPVFIDRSVYLLEITTDKSFLNQSIYRLKLIKFDSYTGRVSGTFLYSTFFED